MNVYAQPEFIIVLALILSVVIICFIVFAKKNQKRKTEITQQLEQKQLISQENKTHLENKLDTPQIGMNLEEIKGIGAKTAEKLRNANITTVTDLSKASANILSQKTEISEKLLSKWIELAKENERT
jgi:predicted flap endonuclease-1-like 5' DNA nuclease